MSALECVEKNVGYLEIASVQFYTVLIAMADVNFQFTPISEPITTNFKHQFSKFAFSK